MMFGNYYKGDQPNYTLHLFSIFLLLCSDYVADLIKKIGIVFNCFTKDQIWACPNKCAQNWYSDVENSLCQPPACFLAQSFVYSIESLGEIIFCIFKLKK